MVELCVGSPSLLCVPCVHSQDSSVGYGWFVALMNYGPQWRRQRRALHQTLAPGVLPQYCTTVLAATHGFLRLLLRKPAHDLASKLKL